MSECALAEWATKCDTQLSERHDGPRFPLRLDRRVHVSNGSSAPDLAAKATSSRLQALDKARNLPSVEHELFVFNVFLNPCFLPRYDETRKKEFFLRARLRLPEAPVELFLRRPRSIRRTLLADVSRYSDFHSQQEDLKHHVRT